MANQPLEASQHAQLLAALSEKETLAAQLAASELRLCRTLEAAEIGTWEWNIADNRVFWSPDIERIFRLAPGSFAGTYEAWMTLVHPDERAMMASKVAAALSDGQPYQAEFRVQRPDGTVGWQSTRGYVVRGDDGAAKLLRGIVQDVTEQVTAKQQADQLAASLSDKERQLRLITNALPALVAHVDRNEVYQFANQAYVDWYCSEPQNLVGRPMRDVMGQHDYSKSELYIRRALGGEAVQFEAEVALKGGGVAYLQRQYIPDKDKLGNTRGFIALIQDITDRRRDELALESERARLHDVLMKAPASISIRSGPDHVFTLVNPIYQELSGDRQLLGKPMRDALPEIKNQRFLPIVSGVYQSGQTFSGKEVPTPIEKADGTVENLFLNVAYQPVRNAHGDVDAVVSFAVDVTEQVKARQQAEDLASALAQSESRYRAFVGQSTEGIWRIEVERPIPIHLPTSAQIELFYEHAFLAECNDAMARMYGYQYASDLVGARLGDLLVRQDERNAAYLSAFIESGYRLEGAESHEVDRNGNPRVFHNGLVGSVEDGHLVRAWGTQRDVTAQVNAREQAEAANRAKDEFLAMLGHELRNPLSPILTALELMKLRGADVLQKERAIIERQVKHVVRLVDDLLDVSRMTRGKISLDRQPVDLAQNIATAIELASPLLEQRSHRLSVDVPTGLFVQGDTTRLSQVFANLLMNAAKYTPAGGSISIAGDTVNGQARVRVKDSGIGIRKEILPHIFELFVQEPQALDRSEGGLGLGLAIVHSLVTQHGGRVQAHSEGPGLGSEFSVFLPLSLTAGQVALAAPNAAGPPASDVRRVLLVDDNRDGADLMADALTDAGHTVRVAYDGPSALAMVAGWTPQVALLDIGLPVMDGYELAKQMRSKPDLRDIKLVAVTGYGQATDREASRAAGFDEHLVKPVNLTEVERVILTSNTRE